MSKCGNLETYAISFSGNKAKEARWTRSGICAIVLRTAALNAIIVTDVIRLAMDLTKFG